MRQTPYSTNIIAQQLPTIIEPEQKDFNLWIDDLIAPFTCGEYPVYTVEEGTIFVMQSTLCSVTSNTTGMASHKTMKLFIYTPGYLGCRYFRRTDTLTFAPSWKIKAGDSLYIYLDNLSSDEVRLRMNIAGVIVAR